MPEFTDRLEIPIPALGEEDWRGTYVEAFVLLDDLVGRITQAGGLTFVRRYTGSEWPSRGELPVGSSVVWVKPSPGDPDPPTGGAGLLVDTDLVVVATS